MPFDRLAGVGEPIRERWTALERDWQSVVVGTAIVTAIALSGVQIPW